MERLEGMTEEQDAIFFEWLDFARPKWREMVVRAIELSDGQAVDIRTLLPVGSMQAPFLAWKLMGYLERLEERLAAACA